MGDTFEPVLRCWPVWPQRLGQASTQSADDPCRNGCDLSPLLRHAAVTVFVGYLGTTQQHLRGVAAIERNRLPSEVLKRLFAPLHLASLTRVLRGDPAGRGNQAHAIALPRSQSELAAPRRDIAGNRDPWWRLRGCEEPRLGATIASDPVAPSRFPDYARSRRSSLAGCRMNLTWPLP
jgi:hypothetical protein